MTGGSARGRRFFYARTCHYAGIAHNRCLVFLLRRNVTDPLLPPPRFAIDARPGGARLALGGAWRRDQARPAPAAIVQAARSALPGGGTLAVDGSALGPWDGTLPALLRELADALAPSIVLDLAALPAGAARLVALASASVPPDKRTPPPDNFFRRIGQSTLDRLADGREFLRYLGEIILALGAFLGGRARMRRSDFWWVVQEVGPQAFPIVTLISLLVGLILAYMGAQQLAMFGAQIYIADLVGIGMVREIAALMTGIVVAGRSGAAFAAQLGTMQVNQEIDAFRTWGIPPVEFLVLPRLLALVVMMPLLTLYAGLVGVLGGALVALTIFDIGAFEYYHQTLAALTLTHMAVGLFKGTLYGSLVALAGCVRGLQCGRSAQAVGEATTSAVVTSILFIVVAASLTTIVFQKLGI